MGFMAMPLVALLFLATLLLALFLLPGHIQNDDEMKLCTTRGCVEHGLALGIDNRRRPSACDDFSAFICLGWKLAEDDLSTTVNSQATLLFIMGLEKMSLDGYEEMAVVNRPLSMMRGCMERSADDPDAVMSFLEMVDRTNLAWPTIDDEHEPPFADYSRPLQLLLELSVIWALPLWFRVRVLPSRSPIQSERAVLISTSSLPAMWHGLHEMLLLYEDAYETYVSFFNDSIFKYRPPSKSFTFFLRTSVSVQTQVLGNLSAVFHASHKQPKLVAIQSLPTLIRKLGADDWVRALASVYGTEQNITPSDLLLAANENLLKAADSILNANTAQDIFFHTIWWFVQSIGALASKQLLFTLNEHRSGKHFQRLICFDQVATTYNVLLASIDKARRSSRERSFITSLIENIRVVAIEKVRSFYKISATLRKVLPALLEGMSTVIWPEDDFGRPGGFEHFYGQPYRGKGGFFEEWKWSRLQMHNRSAALFRSKEYVAAAQVYTVVSNRLFTYNPVLNTMSVSMAALQPPFYYEDATNAMTYAGLGYICAQEIFEALDIMTHLFNGATVIHPSDATDTPAFWNASWCPTPFYNRYTYPELPALDVAYTAYMRSRDMTSDLPLKSLRYFRPDQIFFATFCHCTCYMDTSKRAKQSEVCYEAVKNYDPFASAFSCPDGSKMNQGPKCAYI